MNLNTENAFESQSVRFPAEQSTQNETTEARQVQ